MTTQKIGDHPEIDSLLVKILEGRAENHEIELFSNWIKDYRNELYFDRFKEMWHISTDDAYFKNNKGLKDSSRFVNYIRQSKLRQRYRRVLVWSVSAAAVIVLFFNLLNFIGFGGINPFDSVDFNQLSYSADSVRIEINDGEVVKSIKGAQSSITTINGELAQAIPEEKSRPKTYNAVTTPSGERVVMVLSDDTRVYLTSNSYLRYPSQFDKDKREVTLVGRAYFEVKKSNTPFIVNTADMDIEVLGTSFDVEAKSTGNSASVILVEGSVKVHASGVSKVIYPNEQINFLRETREMTVKSVDSKLLTMWKDGVLVVHGHSFEELVESLASWYGVRIIDRTSVSPNEKFHGRFDREDIVAAIKAVAISANIKYRIEDGKLILEDKWPY